MGELREGISRLGAGTVPSKYIAMLNIASVPYLSPASARARYQLGARERPLQPTPSRNQRTHDLVRVRVWIRVKVRVRVKGER